MAGSCSLDLSPHINQLPHVLLFAINSSIWRFLFPAPEAQRLGRIAMQHDFSALKHFFLAILKLLSAIVIASSPGKAKLVLKPEVLGFGLMKCRAVTT
jgi:hypothetical protein